MSERDQLPSKGAPEPREARLAKALRANLRRRKAAGTPREEPHGEPDRR